MCILRSPSLLFHQIIFKMGDFSKIQTDFIAGCNILLTINMLSQRTDCFSSLPLGENCDRNPYPYFATNGVQCRESVF